MYLLYYRAEAPNVGYKHLKKTKRFKMNIYLSNSTLYVFSKCWGKYIKTKLLACVVMSLYFT